MTSTLVTPDVAKMHEQQVEQQQQAQQAQEQVPGEQLYAVTVKLPPFWAQEAEVWFSQAESQFLLRGITSDETKYHHVVSSLDYNSASMVRDLLKQLQENTLS